MNMQDRELAQRVADEELTEVIHRLHGSHDGKWLVEGCLMALERFATNCSGNSQEMQSMVKELFPEEPPAGNSFFEDPRFTNEDKNTIIEQLMDEIRDCLKDSAHDRANSESLIELISYADGDPELTANTLQSMTILDGRPRVNGEFLRVHDDDDENYAETLDFAKRMKLIDEAEENVTQLGLEYMERWL